MVRFLPPWLGFGLALGMTLTPSVGLSQTVATRDSGSEPESRVEARQSFDRGLALYEAGDYTGALAEFQRAYDLTGHPLVLFNVALVQAKLGNSIGAVTALEELKAKGLAQLGPERSLRAQQVYADQVLRVGSVTLECNVPVTTAQVDNVDVSPTATLRLTVGQHLLSVFAPGYAPRHLSFSVLGKAHRVVEVELTPLAESSSRVRITSDVPDVEVRDAGQLLGRLPFDVAVVLAPGAHELEFSREGYAVERRRVVFPAGGESSLHVPMHATVADGRLSLRVSEANAVISVDGKPTLPGPGGLALPRGRHALRVQRAGFYDVSREVVLPPGPTVLEVRLLPTPEYLDQYIASAKRQRTLAFITGGSGLVFMAGGGAFLLWNQGQKNDAKRAFDDYDSEIARSPTGVCDRRECEMKLGVLLDNLDQTRKRDLYGWLGVGVGGAALSVGALFYLLGDDPTRYRTGPGSDVFGSLKPYFDARTLGLAGSY